MLTVAINNAKHACVKKALQVLHDVTLGVHDEGLSVLLDELEAKLSSQDPKKEDEKARDFLESIHGLLQSLDQAHPAAPTEQQGGPPQLSLRALVRVKSDPMDPLKVAERADAWKKAQAARRRLVQLVTATTKSEIVRHIDRFVKQSKVRFALNEKHILYMLSLDVAGESSNSRTNPAWKIAGQIGKLDNSDEKRPLVKNSAP